jgi:hypothetical protein
LSPDIAGFGSASLTGAVTGSAATAVAEEDDAAGKGCAAAFGTAVKVALDASASFTAACGCTLAAWLPLLAAVPLCRDAP